jgi:hypothetical protein
VTGYEQQLRLLYDEQDRREAEAREQHGLAWLENNWITIARDVIAAAPESVTDKAKREFLRCNFIC